MQVKGEAASVSLDNIYPEEENKRQQTSRQGNRTASFCSSDEIRL